MTKLKGLLLTEGMHGMISQVEGLAKALNLEFIHEKIELNNFWKMIPPKITPVKDFIFKNNISEKFNFIETPEIDYAIDGELLEPGEYFKLKQYVMRYTNGGTVIDITIAEEAIKYYDEALIQQEELGGV